MSISSDEAFEKAGEIGADAIEKFKVCLSQTFNRFSALIIPNMNARDIKSFSLSVRDNIRKCSLSEMKLIL